MNKFYALGLASMLFGSSMSFAQTETLFQQEMLPNSTAIAASSTEARTVHLADDFMVNESAQVTSITLIGAQVFQNLPSILQSVDVFILQTDELTMAPSEENAVYASLQNMDNVELVSNGFDQNFIIDLTEANLVLEPGHKYWIVFSAYIDAPYPSNITDWHNYPGINLEGTSLAQVYTNGDWMEMETGMTFLVEGTTSLGTNEVFTQKKKVLASTLVQDQLITNLDNFESLQVYDLSGKLILSSDKVSTPVSFLAAGTYVAVLKDKEGKSFKAKFIKK